MPLGPVSAGLFFALKARRSGRLSAKPSSNMSDLTVPELEQLARFDQHWRVVLGGDDSLVVWELRKCGYLDVLKRQPPLYRLSKTGREALSVIR